jgi:hypothetical protein
VSAGEKTGTGSEPSLVNREKTAFGEVPVPILFNPGEKMGTGSEPNLINREKTAFGEVPVPIFWRCFNLQFPFFSLHFSFFIFHSPLPPRRLPPRPTSESPQSRIGRRRFRKTVV